MSMKYIRDKYKVPAKRGMLVIHHGGNIGHITSASCYIKVRSDIPKRKYLQTLHPTDDVAYLKDNGEWHYESCSILTKKACKTYSQSKASKRYERKSYMAFTDQYQVTIHYIHPKTGEIKTYTSKTMNVPYIPPKSGKNNHAVASLIAIRDLMLELNVAANLQYVLIEVNYL